jgi:hypothetical protein
MDLGTSRSSLNMIMLQPELIFPHVEVFQMT